MFSFIKKLGKKKEHKFKTGDVFKTLTVFELCWINGIENYLCLCQCGSTPTLSYDQLINLTKAPCHEEIHELLGK
jgi:hypothetical protein